MNMTRRKLLSGAVVGVPALALVGCATNPITGAPEINPQFVDDVISALQAGCNVGLAFIPTVTSVSNVVASLFGPAATATVQLINGSIAAVAGAICSAVPTIPAAQASLRRRLVGSTYRMPIYIGTTPPAAYAPGGVTIHGYQNR